MHGVVSSPRCAHFLGSRVNRFNASGSVDSTPKFKKNAFPLFHNYYLRRGNALKCILSTTTTYPYRILSLSPSVCGSYHRLLNRPYQIEKRKEKKTSTTRKNSTKKTRKRTKTKRIKRIIRKYTPKTDPCLMANQPGVWAFLNHFFFT